MMCSCCKIDIKVYEIYDTKSIQNGVYIVCKYYGCGIFIHEDFIVHKKKKKNGLQKLVIASFKWLFVHNKKLALRFNIYKCQLFGYIEQFKECLLSFCHVYAFKFL